MTFLWSRSQECDQLLMRMETTFERKAGAQINISCQLLLGFRATTFRYPIICPGNGELLEGRKCMKKARLFRQGQEAPLDPLSIMEETLVHPIGAHDEQFVTWPLSELQLAYQK
jgi:hypothetical protein